MRAVVCNELGPPDKLVVEERPRLEPGPGQVSIAVRACGVNFVDSLMTQGLYQIKPEPPFVPGGEVAGEVDAVGPDVSGIAVGDRVIAMPGLNGFAEQVIARASQVLPLPDALDFERGATLIQSYCTALFALEVRGRLQPGETLLVLGAAGGVGLAAIDVGRALGARVIAAASTPEKLETCKAAGAEAGICYENEPLKDRVREIAGGADVVYDPVGGDFSEPALRTLRPGGRFLVIGFATGTIPRMPLNLVLLKSCQVVGVDWGGTSARDRELNPRLLRRLVELLDEGAIDPPRPRVYPLERAGEALADLAGRRIHGKAALVP